MNHQAIRRIIAQLRTASDVDTAYRGEHRAPGKNDGESSAPLHDMTAIWPKDFYETTRHYLTGNDYDYESLNQIMRARGNPNARVTIYRAIPHDVWEPYKKAYDKWWRKHKNDTVEDTPPAPEKPLHAGDWVTLSKTYAEEHSESALRGQGKVVKKQVKASQVWTDGNDINEFGYDP